MDNNFEYDQADLDARRGSVSMMSENVDKKKYKLLKKALKEQLEFRANLEAELMGKIKKLEEQTLTLEELKE